MIKQVYEMPTEGQFVAMWVHNGKLWCETWRHGENGIEAYDESWEESWSSIDPDNYPTDNRTYFILS